MFIPRVLIFDKTDGHCIVNTGIILYGGRKIKSDDEIINSYTELQERNIDDLYIHRESFSAVSWACEFDDQFSHGGIPTYDSETDEIMWEYSEIDQEIINKETKLTEDVEALKSQMSTLGRLLVQEKLKGGETV